MMGELAAPVVEVAKASRKHQAEIFRTVPFLLDII